MIFEMIVAARRAGNSVKSLGTLLAGATALRFLNELKNLNPTPSLPLNLSGECALLQRIRGFAWQFVRKPGLNTSGKGRILVMPFFFSSSATRALVASLGHEQ
jgi:hypothetical protein